jgi:hydrogenase maturation protein HypF
VYHHHAHAAVLCGEYPDVDRWLAFTWDGVGLGADKTLWGGEALFGHTGDWQHVASMRPFNLPGGDSAAREPWRSALSLCWETGTDWQPASCDTALLHHAWQKRLNSPQTSAVGRLFDAAGSLSGLLDDASYEGQGPMLLEAIADRAQANAINLPLSQDAQGIWRSDWSVLLPMLLDNKLSREARATCFHESMTQALVMQARLIREQHGDFCVGLCGGVFQNKLLSERVAELLKASGFRYAMPEQVPVNDAGLCYGQVVEAMGYCKTA